MKHNCKFYWCK